MRDKIAEAFASRKDDVRQAWADTREKIQLVRDTAPTLTTALLVVVVAVGFGAGWYASKPFQRAAVNKEWRAKIAANSTAVRNIVAAGDAEITATDDEIIEALGDTDEKLAAAERNLKNANRSAVGSDPCRIRAECLRKQ